MTPGLVVAASLVPLAALVFWLERTVTRFSPPQADDAASASPDALVRRLAEDLQRAQAEPARRPEVYLGVVRELAPTIRRRLTAGADVPVEARARLEAALDAHRNGTAYLTTPAQLEQLLSDLERR